MPDPIPYTSDLAAYVNDVLFRQFAENRKKLIEPDWEKARKHYRKIDTVKWKKREAKAWRSKTFVGKTREKVTSHTALLKDQILQGGQFPYMLVASPMEQQRLNTMVPFEQARVRAGIEGMKNLIDEQLTNCDIEGECGKWFESLGLYGECIAKRGITMVGTTTSREVTGPNGIPMGWETVYTAHASPSEEYTSVWELYRDIENPFGQGAGEIQQRMVSPYWLRQRKGMKFFMSDAIDKVLSNVRESERNAGTSTPPEDEESLPPRLRNIPHRKNTIVYREAYVTAPKDIVENFEKSVDWAEMELEGVPRLEPMVQNADEEQQDGEDVEVIVCTANKQIVKFMRSSRSLRPFRRCVASENLDEVAPDSVAIRLVDSQIMLNGSIRAMEDNKKLASDVILTIKERWMENPERLKDGVDPGMLLRLSEDCDDARKAVQQVIIQDVSSSLIDILNLAMQFSDEESLLPKISQGIEVDKKQTAYELSQLVEKAGKTIGSVIKNFDNFIESIVTDFYLYNMNDPDCPVEKGDWTVEALGFTSFQDRVVQVEKLLKFLTILMQAPPEVQAKYQIDYIIEEIGKRLDLHVKQMKKSEEQLAAEQQAKIAEATAVAPEESEVLQAKAVSESARAKVMDADADVRRGKLALDQAKAAQEIINGARQEQGALAGSGALPVKTEGTV